MNKAIQGVGDANRLWVEHRDKRIISWGWTKLDAEPSTIYITHLDKFIRMVADTDEFLVSTNCASYLAQQSLRFESEWQITIQSPVHQHTNLRLDRTPPRSRYPTPKASWTSWPSTTYKTLIRLPHHTWTATTYPHASPTNPYFRYIPVSKPGRRPALFCGYHTPLHFLYCGYFRPASPATDGSSCCRRPPGPPVPTWHP
jgi:hypothetical protein